MYNSTASGCQPGTRLSRASRAPPPPLNVRIDLATLLCFFDPDPVVSNKPRLRLTFYLECQQLCIKSGRLSFLVRVASPVTKPTSSLPTT
jgi:hypothetical protein